MDSTSNLDQPTFGSENPKNSQTIEGPLKNSHQALKLIWQRVVDMGYDVIQDPYLEIEDNPVSDILLKIDTLTRGMCTIRITEIGQMIFEGLNLSQNESFRTVGEITKNMDFPGMTIFLKDTQTGELIPLPDEIPQHPHYNQDEQPPLVPLDQQNLSHDIKTGAWYGSPKK